MTIQKSAGDDSSQCDCVFEHIAEGAGQFITFDLFGRHRFGWVKQDGDVELFGLLEKPMELRFIAPATSQIGVEKDSNEAQSPNTPVEFIGGGLWILHRQRAQATESCRVCCDDFRERIVNQLGDGGTVGAEPFGAGVIAAQEGELDTVGIHGGQFGFYAGVGCRDFSEPTSHFQNWDTLLVDDKRFHLSGAHHLDDFRKEKMALAIDEPLVDDWMGAGRVSGWLGLSRRVGDGRGACYCEKCSATGMELHGCNLWVG